MARFYGELWGAAAKAVTRVGNRRSGIAAHIRSWNLGVEIHGREDSEGRTVFEIYATSGSLGAYPKELIGILRRASDVIYELEG